jgi:hypothetical protein
MRFLFHNLHSKGRLLLLWIVYKVIVWFFRLFWDFCVFATLIKRFQLFQPTQSSLYIIFQSWIAQLACTWTLLVFKSSLYVGSIICFTKLCTILCDIRVWICHATKHQMRLPRGHLLDSSLVNVTKDQPKFL